MPGAITKMYMLGPVVVAAGQVNQIQEYAVDPGIETVAHSSDGQVDNNLVAVLQQSPRFGFTTTAIKRGLDIAGIGGYAVAASADLYFQAIAQAGVRSGGTTSFRLRGATGLLIPQTLQASHKQYAKLTMALVLISADGEAAPFTGTGSVAMPTVTAADQLYTVGPAYLNGTEVEGVQDTTVDFGLDLVVEGGSGSAYPTFVGIKRRQPTITLRTTDPTLLGTTGYFDAQGATDSLFYFRKVAVNGTRVPAATAGHIKIAVDDGMFVCRPPGGDTDNPQMNEMVITPTWDGTNDVLAISTAAAIA